MFKLCKTCGYINKGEAIECEECHSLLNIDIKDKIPNKKDDSRTISVSGIFQNVYTNGTNANNAYNKNSEDLHIDKNYINNSDLLIEEDNTEIIAPDPLPEAKTEEKPIVEVKKEETKAKTEVKVEEKEEPAAVDHAQEIQKIMDEEYPVDETTIIDLPPEANTYYDIPIDDNNSETIDYKPEEEKIEIVDNDEIKIEEIGDTSKVEKTANDNTPIEEKPTEEPVVIEKAVEEKAEPQIPDKQDGSNKEINEIEDKMLEIINNLEEDDTFEAIKPVEKKEEPIEIIKDDAFESIENEDEEKEEIKEEDNDKNEEESSTNEKDIENIEEDKDENEEDKEENDDEEVTSKEENDTKKPDIDDKPINRLSQIKPMVIKKRTTEATHTKSEEEDESLTSALEVFDSINTRHVEEAVNPEPKKETIVYDLNSDNGIKTKPSEEKEEAKEQSKQAVLITPNKKKKSKKDDKTKSTNPDAKKFSFIRKSITISAILAIIIIGAVIIINVNKTKDLKTLCTTLTQKNDISYESLFNNIIDKGFSEKDATKAIEELDINFEENAMNVLYTAAQDSNKLASKADVRTLLESKLFTNSDIEYALTNADWNKYLSIYVDACVAKTKELDKNTIISNIKAGKFDLKEINYIKDEYDWTKLAKKNIDSFLKGDDLHTKEETRIKLVELGYSDKDIEDTFEIYEWDSYAYTFLTKYLNQQETNGESVELTRNTYTEILTKAGFAEEEIASVLSRFDFASIAGERVDSFIAEGKDFINKLSIKDTLSKDGYTQSEIEKVLAETNWNEAAMTSLKSLDNAKLSKKEMITKLTDSGYEEKEIEYVEKNYDWSVQGIKYIENLKSQQKNGNEEYLRALLKENGYTTEEINKLIVSLNFEKTTDWFEDTAKVALSSITNSDNFTRKKAKDYLTSLHYGEKEINAALNSISLSDWKNYAIKYLDEADFNTRIDARSLLQNAGFLNTSENKEIDYAIKEYNWTNKCVTYARSLYNQMDACTKYKSYNYYYHNIGDKTKNDSALYSALLQGEYTENEIANALDNYIFTKEPSSPGESCPLQ